MKQSSASDRPQVLIRIITRFREKDNRKSRLIFTSGKSEVGQEKFFGKGKKGPNCC